MELFRSAWNMSNIEAITLNSRLIGQCLLNKKIVTSVMKMIVTIRHKYVEIKTVLAVIEL